MHAPSLPRALCGLATLALTSAGCAGRFDVTGGPRRVQVQIDPDHILDGIQPLVVDDASATRRVAEVRRRERIGKGLLYAEFALLAGCIAVNASSDPLDPGSTSYVGVGLCGATIAVGLTAVFVLPRKSTYGSPLRVYNERHPEAPYVAPKLGVTPPRGDVAQQ